MPGVRKEDIKVEIDGSRVAILAGRKRESEEKHGSVVRSERHWGQQYRSFNLPPAPLNLVYVSRIDRRVGMRRPHAAALATIRTAALCENVDRFCAIEGMAATVRGWLDRPSLLDSIGLDSDEQLLLVQSIGYVANGDDDSPNAWGAAARATQ